MATSRLWNYVRWLAVSVSDVDNTNQSWRKDWKIGDRYSIQKILGAGSYGDVAKVIDTKTGEIVWCKLGIERVGGDQKDW